MCGVFGGVTSFEVSTDYVRSQIHHLRHRGPDTSGVVELDDLKFKLVLGHTRLAINDLSSAGEQPFISKDRGVYLSINGEIYNWKGLRQALTKKNRLFSSSSDCEVVLHGYLEYGLEIFNLLQGIYAGAILDVRSKKIFIFRDKVGVKPIYIESKGESVSFASEIRSFRSSLPARPEVPRVNYSNLEKLIYFPYLSDGETNLQDVTLVPPGKVIEVSYGEPSGRLEINSHDCSIEANPQYYSDNRESLIENVRATLIQAIRRQSEADVPIYHLLSGGLDSTIVAAVNQEILNKEVSSISAVSSSRYNENEFSRLVAKRLGGTHIEVNLDQISVSNDLDKIIDSYDGLNTTDPGLVSLYYLYQKISEAGVKVALTGDGADELFGGYTWFRLSSAPLRYLPRWFKDQAIDYAISRAIPTVKYLTKKSRFLASTNDHVLGRELKHQLPNHFLLKTDLSSMRSSVEARVPFLDEEVVKLVMSTPFEEVLSSSKAGRLRSAHHPKILLKEAFADVIPQKIIQRPKHGFLFSISEWMAENRDCILDTLQSEVGFARNHFSRAQIDSLVRFKVADYSPIHKHKEFLCWRLFLINSWECRWKN